MTIRRLDPLDWQVSLVSRDGRPTPEFQRKWAAMRANTSQIPTVTLGTGAPGGVPATTFYFDTSTTPWTSYAAGADGAWHRAGVVKFTELQDVPSSYAGAAKKLLRVKSTADGIEFISLSAELDDGLGLSLGNIAMRGASTWGVLADANDATKFLNGAHPPAYAAVKDSDLSTSDITTNNVSTSKHGFAPKAPNDATKYLDGTGAYSTPAGSGAVTLVSSQTVSGVSSVVFTIAASSDYEIVASGFSVASGTPNLQIQVGSGSPVTWDTGNDYFWITFGAQSGSAGPTNAMQLCATLPSGRVDAFSFRTIGLWGSGASDITFRGTFPFSLHDMIGLRFGGSAVTAVRIILSTGGNFSGTFKQYRLAA